MRVLFLLCLACTAACSCVACDDDCATKKAATDTASDGYRLARIEFIKQQILRKLRLKEPPRIRMGRSALPSVLGSEDATRALLEDDEDAASSGNNAVRNAPEDDDYGMVKTAVIFPENDTTSHCHLKGSAAPSACLVFKLSPEIQGQSVSSAMLWAFKEPSAIYRHKTEHTLVVSEVAVDKIENVYLRKKIATYKAVSVDGWIQFNVTELVRVWTTGRKVGKTTYHGLEISCKTCQSRRVGGVFSGSGELPISRDEATKRPFLVVKTDPSRMMFSRRQRRSVDCDSKTSRCCRESFYISFKEIGWDNWIVQPAGYSANYCRGSCVHDASITRYHHTTVIQTYLQKTVGNNETRELALCCTPSRLSSISLIYINDENDILQKKLTNMVVEACDCA